MTYDHQPVQSDSQAQQYCSVFSVVISAQPNLPLRHRNSSLQPRSPVQEEENRDCCDEAWILRVGEASTNSSRDLKWP